ncbi:MAG TPA: GNAT family N-acetyltransferase [Actinomycetota bacterium]|nr:GNAT family N-acetyltransferase [Actinomycetota bacterium]
MSEPVPVALPEGLTARPPTRDDVEAIFGIVAACELANDGKVETERIDVETLFDRFGFEPVADALLVFDGARPVAWAELYRGRSEGDVVPDHRGRGIGAALLAWIEERARASDTLAVGQPKTDGDAGARELFLAHGYEPSWTAWIIRIDLDASPMPPNVPPGISIRPYQPGDARAVHALIEEAFSEWEGRDPTPFEVWAPMAIDHPAFSPERSPLAFDGDEIVGVVISHDSPQEGWIDQVATRASHRRRGIAQALLRTAFVGFAAQGYRTAGVSTDSRTGALGLYEKVGMRVVRQYTRYRKHLSR